jgi:hypothetical protein
MRKLYWIVRDFIFIIGSMERVIAYMVTFTTYGTWLQGDKRGYVKDGQTLEGNERLLNANKTAMRQKTVRLTQRQKEIVKQAILNEAQELKQKIFAILVWSTHIHIVAENIDETVGKVTGRYKAEATKALREAGFEGKVWTKGFDKRFCFNEEELRARIEYLNKHGE